MKKFLLYTSIGAVVGSSATVIVPLRMALKSDLTRPMVKEFVGDVIYATLDRLIYPNGKPYRRAVMLPRQSDFVQRA